MKAKIYIYEDAGYKNFLPLVYLRPVFDLYCGIFTFSERIQKLYPNSEISPLSRFISSRPMLTSSPALFINGRAILHSPLPDKEGVFVAGDEVVGFKIRNLSQFIGAQATSETRNLELAIGVEFLNTLKEKLKPVEVKATMIRYPWELIKENKSTIIKDFELLSLQNTPSSKHRSQSKKKICVSKSAKIDDGVFMRGEYIYIGENAQIRPLTSIEGPCFIGEGSIIEGAKIKPGTTIGRNCRIGGEVEESIFSDFSNKHHEGFVGHSFIGEWVNLGAGTTTSDLKNTYGTVKVPVGATSSSNPSVIQHLDSGLLKLGSFIGDHTKTGIGTLLDTGSILGCFVNIYGGGLAPKYVPSFSWGTKDSLGEYKLAKAIEVAKRVMARRGVTLTTKYEQTIRKAFELTKSEREVALKTHSPLKPKDTEEAILLEKILHGQI